MQRKLQINPAPWPASLRNWGCNFQYFFAQGGRIPAGFVKISLHYPGQLTKLTNLQKTLPNAHAIIAKCH
jgi:hypothetical protein